MRSTRVVAYRLPDETFVPDPDVGGYWLSREAVVPVELVELGDLVELHARLRDRPPRRREPLASVASRVVASSLEYSGIRLHNALPARRALAQRALLRHASAAREAGWCRC